MAGQLPEKTRKLRRDEAMGVQQRIAREVSAGYVGRILRVLVEKETTARALGQARVSNWEHGLIRGAEETNRRWRGRFFECRGEADAPDIDGRVYVRGELKPGEFAWARITGSSDYDLFGEAVPAGRAQAGQPA
jgi:ribosomal protein S12 methylthiotransferase